MRIALVVPGGVSRDGEYKVIPALLWLIERIARRHDVVVVVPNQEPRTGCWELFGARVHNVAGRPWGPRAFRMLRRLHRERPIDVFHAIWAGGPAQVTWLAARSCRRPLLVHVAGGELIWLPDIEYGARRWWRRALSGFVLRRADRVTAASDVMGELIARTGARPLRLPLGVDTDRWTPETPRVRPTDRPARVVHVGSLTPVKGHATLLRAVASLVADGWSIHLDLVGVDALQGTVHRLSSGLGLQSRVTFHGFLPQRLAIPVVRAADLMAVTSRHEAGPVAMLEAAALGVPTIGTPVGHVLDWAPEAAVMVPAGDPEALARGIARLLTDDQMRLEIARRAQQAAVRENADWTAARFEELYSEVVSHGKPTGG